MQQIERLTENDFNKYHSIFTSFGIVSGNEVDDGFKIFRNGKDYLVFPVGPLFLVYHMDGEQVVSSIMQVDELYNLVTFTYEGKQILVKENGIDVIFENHQQQSLYLRKNGNEDLDLANNGLVSFLQYSPEYDTSLEMRYEHNIYQDNQTIYPYHLDEPFYMTFLKNASKSQYHFLKSRKSYYRFDFDATRNMLEYDLATINEYGLGAVLSQGSVSLQGTREFSRFYRVLLQVGESVTITGFPFSRSYQEEDLYEIAKRHGFVTRIPEDLIDLYHKREQLLKERQGIIDIYKNSEYFIESEMVLKK